MAIITATAPFSAPLMSPAILSAQLMSEPEALLSELIPGTPICEALQDPSLSVRRAAQQEAPQDPDFQEAHALLARVVQAEPPDGGWTGPQQRAEKYLRSLQLQLDAAFARPDLGHMGLLLSEVVSTQSELISGDIEAWRGLGGAAASFVETYKQQFKESQEAYTGFLDPQELPGMDELRAVENALRVLLKDVGAALVQEISREVYAELLEARDPELLTRYRELDPASLFAEASRVQQTMNVALFGSEELEAAYWENKALIYEMACRDDWDFEAHEDLAMLQVHGRLSQPERDRLLHLKQTLLRRMDDDNLVFHYELLDGIEYFYRRAQEFALSDQAADRFIYLDAAQDLAVNALRIGMPSEWLQELATEHGSVPEIQPVTMEQIRTRPVEITPEALPEEVKQTLRETGMWEAVRRSAKRIILMPEDASAEQIKQLVGAAPHGRTYFMDGTVVIATQSRDPATGAMVQFEPWQIAGLLVHEVLGHINLLKEVEGSRDVALLKNVPQERQAYAWEAEFYRRYREQAWDRLDPSQRMSLAELTLSTESVVHVTNILLGIPVDELAPKAVLAGEDQAFAHFGATRALIDWNRYPLRQVSLLGRIELDGELDLDLMDVREKLDQQVAELSKLMAAKKAYLKDRVVEAAVAHLAAASEDGTSPEDIEKIVVGLPRMLALLETEPGFGDKVGPDLVATLQVIRDRLNLDMPMLQIADFLEGFEGLQQGHRAYYDELFHGLPMGEAIENS